MAVSRFAFMGGSPSQDRLKSYGLASCREVGGGPTGVSAAADVSLSESSHA
jgi:hypothetical protein